MIFLRRLLTHLWANEKALANFCVFPAGRASPRLPAFLTF